MPKGQTIYLDHAAATPLDIKVESVMQPFLRNLFYNPSSAYAPAVEVRQAYESARRQIAIEIGAQKDDCIITAGATESVNLALTAASDGHVITSLIEHAAVLEASKQYPHTLIAVSSEGLVDPRSIEQAITPATQLVSIGLANSEIGTIQPLSAIAAIIHVERTKRLRAGDKRPIWLHTDASQGVGQLDVSVGRLGVDLLTINAAKIYGPKQVGLLWRRAGVTLKPIVYGGNQESGLRSGTENVAGVVGFAEAIRLVNRRRASEQKRLGDLRNQLQQQLKQRFGEKILFFGNQKKRLASHISLSLPGIDAERLLFMLEADGVLVSTGSACAANNGTGSHVLRAIGASELEVQGSLRLTLGKLNDAESIEAAAEYIIKAVETEQLRIAA